MLAMSGVLEVLPRVFFLHDRDDATRRSFKGARRSRRQLTVAEELEQRVTPRSIGTFS